MSQKYKIDDMLPSDMLCRRLNELSDAVTKGSVGLHLVLDEAAERIEQVEAVNDRLVEALKEIVEWEDGFESLSPPLKHIAIQENVREKILAQAREALAGLEGE